ncbi:hypothetical protein BBJ28_00025251, partial [Nothophytophthora sp. Chile5]
KISQSQDRRKLWANRRKLVAVGKAREELEALQTQKRVERREEPKRQQQQALEEQLLTRGSKYLQQLRPVPTSGDGDKITLPSALEELNPQNALELGIFTLELIRVRFVRLEKGKFASLQPRGDGFGERQIDFKHLLERSLKAHTTLTVGDVVFVRHGRGTFEVVVAELKPEEAVNILDTDLEVAILPSESVARAKVAEKQLEKVAACAALHSTAIPAIQAMEPAMAMVQSADQETKHQAQLSELEAVGLMNRSLDIEVLERYRGRQLPVMNFLSKLGAAGSGDNGVALLKDGPEAFFASIHLYSSGQYFPGTGKSCETGNLINVALENTGACSGSQALLSALENKVLPAMRAFGLVIMFISAGFDGHRDDILVGVATVKYPKRSRWLRGGGQRVGTLETLKLVVEVCDGRGVSVLEGGYDDGLTAGDREQQRKRRG